MSLPSLSQLLTAQTSDEVFAVFVQALVNLGVPANQWRSGGVASTILRVVSITFAGFTSLMVAALSAQFLPYATGDWLTLLAYYVYGTERTPASFASVPCTLTNTGGGIYNYAAGQFTVKQGPSGANPAATYTNQDAIALPAAGAQPSTQTVTFVATVLGSAGNADPGDINTLVTSANGVSVTNAAAAIGTDAQSDTDLRTECTNALAARSVRTVRTAYAWAIQNATNPVTGAPVSINRVQILSPGMTYVSGVPLTPPAAGSPGTVTIYCASPSGGASTDDLNGAAANVELFARSSTATANLVSATVVPYTRTLNVYAVAQPGLSAATVQTSAYAALNALFSTYKIGGLATDNPTVRQGLFGSAISIAIGASQPAGVIFFVEDAANPGSPPPDLALAAGQVASNAITLNVRMATVTS